VQSSQKAAKVLHICESFELHMCYFHVPKSWIGLGLGTSTLTGTSPMTSPPRSLWEFLAGCQRWRLRMGYFCY